MKSLDYLYKLPKYGKLEGDISEPEIKFEIKSSIEDKFREIMLGNSYQNLK